MAMPPMIGYSIRSSLFTNNVPTVAIGAGRDKTFLAPAHPQEDSYWICFISAKNPREKVKEFMVPGSQNSTVPAGIDTYMNDPDYIFAVATQTLSTLHVPQGNFYDFLAKYGAGRELQRLEQINSVYGCGSFGQMSYVLTSQGGPRVPGKPAPASYEAGSVTQYSAMLLMSLMASANGGPPWSICDSYSFVTR
jgi:hypothetical protein